MKGNHLGNPEALDVGGRVVHPPTWPWRVTPLTFKHSRRFRALGTELGSTVRAELNSPILEMGELRLEPAQDMRARTGAQPLLGSWSLPLSLTREPLLSATLDPEAPRDPKDIWRAVGPSRCVPRTQGTSCGASIELLVWDLCFSTITTRIKANRRWMPQMNPCH